VKSLGSTALLLVVVLGLVIYKATSNEPAPSRDFIELELAADDPDHTGTCYSLSTVLIANGVFGDATRTWSMPDPHDAGRWMLRVENVRQQFNGPVREFQDFTFQKVGEQVQLVAVDASAGLPTALAENIDRLLVAPHARRSTPMDRCGKDGAAGYRFTPAKK
jgi:hypothetical protein